VQPQQTWPDSRGVAVVARKKALRSILGRTSAFRLHAERNALRLGFGSARNYAIRNQNQGRAEFFAVSTELAEVLPGTTKLNPRFLAVCTNRFNRFSSMKAKAASRPPLA
jgi:hypothetical protein